MNHRALDLTAALSLSLALTGTSFAASGDPSQWGYASIRPGTEQPALTRKVNEYEGQHRITLTSKDPDVPVTPTLATGKDPEVPVTSS
jgi:hypothetical protein